MVHCVYGQIFVIQHGYLIGNLPIADFWSPFNGLMEWFPKSVVSNHFCR